MTDFPVPEGWVRLTYIAGHKGCQHRTVRASDIQGFGANVLFIGGPCTQVWFSNQPDMFCKESPSEIAAMIGGRREKQTRGLVGLHANGEGTENIAVFFDADHINDVSSVDAENGHHRAKIIYGGEWFFVTESPDEVRRLIEEAKR